jgi:hypothetical protein
VKVKNLSYSQAEGRKRCLKRESGSFSVSARSFGLSKRHRAFLCAAQ